MIQQSKIDSADTLNELFSLIMHDINAPLTYIKGNAEMISIYVNELNTLILEEQLNKEKTKETFKKLKESLAEIIKGSNIISREIASLKELNLEKFNKQLITPGEA